VRVTLALLLAVILGFLVYASVPMTAEASPLDAVRANPAISTVETADSIVLSPSPENDTSTNTGTSTSPGTDTSTGLVFIAGARVDPAAYAAKLSGLAEAGVTVAIVRPVLGFAILEWRDIRTFTSLAPGVDTWFVGGHSLGGVRACQYIADQVDAAPLAGLVLFGSYCAADVSTGSVPALSIAGSEDGLSTPDKIADAAALLPTSTDFVEIAGANHASFGDYGVQPGDGTATADDADVTDAITEAVLAFMTE
jgi:pimeloyl-ACP methyl ester carboxylesterase